MIMSDGTMNEGQRHGLDVCISISFFPWRALCSSIEAKQRHFVLDWEVRANEWFSAISVPYVSF